MPTRPDLYYVRHGQTDWNAEQRFQGSLDIPLNDTGREQARQNGIKLKNALGTADGFSFIASPLSRARETMEIIRREMGLPVTEYVTDERLIETSYGNFEGRTQAEIKAENRELYYERKNNMWTFRPKGGESHADAVARVQDWYTSLEPRRKYLVAGHGAVGRVMRHVVLGLSPAEVSRFVFPQNEVFHFFEGREERF